MRPNAIVLLSLVLAPGGNAALIPSLDILTLTNDAEIIVVGAITSVGDQGATKVETVNGSVSAQSFVATMTVEQVLKGGIAESTLAVQFSLPDVEMGYGGVFAGHYLLAFVRQRDGVYEFVSPYHPALLAVRGARGRGDVPYERVLNILGDGLRLSTDPQIKSKIMFDLARIDSPIVAEALYSVLNDSDETVRLGAAASLLRINQVRALPVAEAALTTEAYRPSESTAGAMLMENLRAGIGNGLRSEDAIPTLERLLQLPDAKTRRVASRALSESGLSSAVGPLMLALDDADFEVRLNAVVGLARLSGRQDLVPSHEGFRQDERKFVDPLRLWALQASR